MRACRECGADISDRRWNAIFCRACVVRHEADGRRRRYTPALPDYTPITPDGAGRWVSADWIAEEIRSRRANGQTVLGLADEYCARYGSSLAAAERLIYHILRRRTASRMAADRFRVLFDRWDVAV